MRKKSDSIVRGMLIIGDVIALMLSFAVAYLIRIYVDPRPHFFDEELIEFILTVAVVVPIMLVIIAALGLYKKAIFFGKSRVVELARLVLAAVLSVAALIVYNFFRGGDSIFPVRVMALSSMALSFVFLVIERFLIRAVARAIFRKDYGTLKVVIVGNNVNTDRLASYISSSPESGYRLSGIVAGQKYISKDLRKYQYASVKDALKKRNVDVIFQTDEKSTEYVYKQAVDRHILYFFVPSETALSSHFGNLELVGNVPAVLVKTTPLSGGAAVVKRLFDIVISLIGIILAAIPMLIIWLAEKMTDFRHSAFYTDERLTQYNRKFRCYKFRSMKPEYSGMTAEEAFKKMGHPELIKKYRGDGDYLKDDPRITKLGKFIRKTSLDELPQLFNILKGDISLIGPRSLLPGELRDYGDRSLILTVKSGLTGLAQVSGRRDISFDERRALDIYYVKNWSLMLDAQIFFKTIWTVLKGEGAK